MRIATQNLKHCEDPKGAVRLDDSVAFLGSICPAVTCLQEVDKLTNRSGRTHQTRSIADALSLRYRFGSACEFDGGEYGISVISSYRIRASRVVQLPRVQGSEPRVALLVTLQDGTMIANVHLSSVTEEATIQLDFLFATIPMAVGIVAGDFNLSLDEYRLPDDWDSAFHGEQPATWPIQHPVQQIDHILYRRTRFGAPRAMILKHPTSDHLGLLADLTQLAS